MRKIVLLFLLTLTLSAKSITPNDVYAQSMLIEQHTLFLLKHYGIKHHDKAIRKDATYTTRLKPRDAWQKSYEILVKINMLRLAHNLARIEPIGMEPVEHLNPDAVYGQTQRILAELKIFEVRKGIDMPKFTLHTYKNKTPLDVFNSFSYISDTFDELNRAALSPSYVFASTMRLYDDLTIILNHLHIKDTTIPTTRLKKATPADSLKISMLALKQIQKLQQTAGIEQVDFSNFNRGETTPSDVYTIIGMILAELQPYKAYLGLIHRVTPAPQTYTGKSLSDVEQLMGWNYRKLLLIETKERR